MRAGRVDLEGELGHRPEHADEVVLLEGVLALMVERDAADQDDHRRVGHVRGGHAGEQIGGAGPAGDEADAGEIRDAGEAVGHEGGGLLVAHVDVLHAPVVVERVEHVEKGRADDPEDVADALRLQQLDHGAPAGHLRHGILPSA